MRKACPQKKDSNNIIKTSKTKDVKNPLSAKANVEEAKQPTPSKIKRNLINITIYEISSLIKLHE